MPGLRYYGDPVLRKAASAVGKFDEELSRLANDMIDTLREQDGVGLAAPQIGVPLRLFVVDTSDGANEPYVLANPEFVYTSEEKADNEEGCLSLPGISLTVSRHTQVSVRAQNARGEWYTIENAEGLLARALQHEKDHLDGILLIDHISPVQRGLLRSKLKKISRERNE